MKKSIIIVLLFAAGAAATLVLAQTQPRLSGGAVQTAASAKLKPGGVPPKGLTETQKRAVIQAANPAIASSGVVLSQPIRLTPNHGTIGPRAHLEFFYPAMYIPDGDEVVYDGDATVLLPRGGSGGGQVEFERAAAIFFQTTPGKSYLVTIGIDFTALTPEPKHFNIAVKDGNEVTQTFARPGAGRTGWSTNGVLSIIVPAPAAGGLADVRVRTPKEPIGWTFYWAEIDPL